MGFIGFYRQYIPNIGELTKKLTELIKKDIKFVWTEEHTAVLNKIKELFKNGAILMYPNFDKKFTLKTDRKSTRLNSSHSGESRMPSSA